MPLPSVMGEAIFAKFFHSCTAAGYRQTDFGVVALHYTTGPGVMLLVILVMSTSTATLEMLSDILAQLHRTIS